MTEDDVNRLTAFLEGIEDGSLVAAEMISDLKSEEAENISNSGLMAQARYMLQATGKTPELIKEMLKSYIYPVVNRSCLTSEGLTKSSLEKVKSPV